MYRLSRSTHVKSLINTQKDVFTTSDLAVLWDISNKNTLWTTVKRYTNSGVLFKIRKGLYSKIALDKLNPYVVGCALGGPHSYISTETILQKAGAIMQFSNTITVASHKTKKLTIGNFTYMLRSFKPAIILNRIGIADNNGFSEASKERALADVNYINPKYYLDNPNAIDVYTLKEIKGKVTYNAGT